MVQLIRCDKCGKLKHPSEFYEYRSSGNTHTSWCKECIELYIKNVSVGAN